MIALIALGAGLLAGLAAGGSPRGIAGLRLRGELAIIGAFILQGVARGRIVGTTATIWGLAVWVVSSILLIGLLLLNLDHPGMSLAAVGNLANLDLVLANSGMPVLPTGGIHLGIVSLPSASGGFYRLAAAGTLGVWAGDVLPLGLLGHTYFLSVGDVLLGVGVSILVASSMLLPEAKAQGCGIDEPTA